MSKVVQWPKSHQEKAVIERLKRLLSEAENGNLFQVAFVGLCQDGTMMECITVDDNMYELLGGIDIMKHRVTQHVIEHQNIQGWN